MTAISGVDFRSQLMGFATETIRLAAESIGLVDRIKPKKLLRISLNDVANHCYPWDCWVVLYDRVYDATSFLNEHPGGSDVILDYAGRDATFAFRGVGHTSVALRDMDKYLIGVLPEDECLSLGSRAPL